MDLPLDSLNLDIETTGLSWQSRVLTVSYTLLRRDDDTDPETRTAEEALSQGLPMVTLQKGPEGSIKESWTWNLGYLDLFTRQGSLPQAIVHLNGMIERANWLVVHNGSFDLPLLERMGLVSYPQLKGKLFDTYVMARCTGKHDSVGMEELLAEFGIVQPGDDPLWEEMKSYRAKMAQADPVKAMTYNLGDTSYGTDLFLRLHERAMGMYDESWIRREGDYSILVGGMRTTGLKLDVEGLARLREEHRITHREAVEKLLPYGINGVNDAKGIARMAKRYGMPLPLTDKDNPITDEPTLSSLPGYGEYARLMEKDGELSKQEEVELALLEGGIAPIAYYILRGRKSEKVISTWVDGFLKEADEESIIHPLWGVSATVSNRLNCTQPNAQAVQRGLHVFTSRPGYKAYDGDYSQAELRIGAGFAREVEMARMFADGIDIHWGTAELMYGKEQADQMRQHGKRSNFTGFYGGGAPALAEALGIALGEATKVINLWRNSYKRVWATSKKAEETWKTRGYLILAHGKRLYATDDDLEHRVYKAFNQLVQGSVAEVIKVAMLSIAEKLPEVLITGQVHDSVKMEAPVDGGPELAAEAKRLMIQAIPPGILDAQEPVIEMKVDMEEV